MIPKTKIAAVIPARMASVRLPGKPLIEVEGLPMIEHVRRRSLLCKQFERVIVATCDEEIARVVKNYGGDVVMTSPYHQVGTERVIEVVKEMDCSHVINIQGDEILVLPSDLEKMTTAILKYPEKPVWNAVAKLEKKEELKDRSIVKCLVTGSGNIFYFSRDFSSFPMPAPHENWLFWVIGLLAYRSDFLMNYPKLVRSRLEQQESIEQLRCLENDIPVASVCLEKAYPGINEKQEIEIVQRYLQKDPQQKEILHQILSMSLFARAVY